MNVSTPYTSPAHGLTSFRSSRNQGYDTAESRRSPRDRSPGRYNDPRDSDQYRGGSYRGTGERRRSIPDARPNNHNTFTSNNRELFAEGTRRDSTRDFSSREPPRGPKASINSLEPLERAPTGPRASIHAPSIHGPDFRSDPSFRGRGRGGRGRGWREDSRDRSRENDREYRDRDRRDDRGPPPFRDDRSRDRERWDPRDSFRGRRPSSPQGRGRSPTYSARDNREPPSTLDLDRGYRGSRDAPSTVSPSSELGPQFVRGYGRVRASRGRGRGSYYDDYHRGPVRSRSPEQLAFTRRPLQSATPPPQVPAFGSTSVKPSLTTPSIPAASATSSGSLHSAPKAPSRDAASSLPPSVPTGPRAVVPPRPALAVSRSSPWARPPDRPSPEIRDHLRENDLFPGYLTAKDDQSAQESVSNRDNESVSEDAPPNLSTHQNEEPQSARSPPREETVIRKRFPVIGRRQPKIPSPITEDSDVDSDSADDDFPNSYFEDEIATKQAQISEVLKSNPLLPPHTPIIASDWRPLYSPIHDKIIPDPCEAPAVQQDMKIDQAKPTAPPRVSPVAAPLPVISVDKRSATPPLPTENSTHETANVDANSDIEPNPVIQGKKIEEDVSGPSEEVKEIVVEKIVEDVIKPSNTARPSVSDDQNTIMVDPPMTETVALDTAFSTRTLEDTSHERVPEALKELSPLERAPENPSTNGTDPLIKPEATVSTRIARIEMDAAPVNDVPEANLHDQHDAMDIDEPVIPETSIQPLSNGNQIIKSAPKIDQFEDSEGSVNEREKEEELEAVRRMMKTPPISSLLKPNGPRFWEHPNLVADLEIRSLKTENELRMHIEGANARRKMEREAEGHAWAQRYYEYRKWTDFSDDPECVRSREKFAASRARAAAEAAAPPISAIASASAKPEGRRGQSRFATDADLERVLKESAQESKEKELDERRARAKTADAKEATIPAMEDGQWWSENVFFDASHKVPFERSFAILEYGEPIDNFTQEESEIFEKVYLETPKNWSRVADALANRDFKACIQHYYLVKHSAKLKDKANSKKRKRGRGPAKNRPKALSASIGNGEDADENQDNENGERKGRPRRAAAPVFPIDAPPPNESESGTPAPTPGRKTAGTPKAEKTDGGSEPGPAKKKVKVAREKGAGKAKNNQLLAAAPIAPAVPRRDDSPATPIPLESKNSRPPSAAATANRFPPQFDGPASQAQLIQPQPAFVPPFVPVERAPPTSAPSKFEILPQSHPPPQTPQQPPPQPYPSSERIESTTPLSFDPQQDRRNTPQTSSYWSVPEQNDFPALLRHFGTDWQGIARHMTSKTHIMVYTNLFQHWLAVPSDSNKSRRVANILTQVKNYYQRQVDSGKMKEWEDIAKEADAKRERGEHMGLPPTPSIIPPKRRYDAPSSGSLPPRSGSALGHVEDIASPGSVAATGRTSQASTPHSQSLSARFPASANAGPVPQIQPAPSPSVMSKQNTPQPTQPSQPSPHSQPASRIRGPPLGYFAAPETPQRPPLQPAHSSSDNAISQRTLQATQAALLEKETALRLEEEQRVQREQRELQQIREQKELQQQREQREREHREQLLREQQINEQREQQRQQQTRFKIDREREQQEQKDREKQAELQSQRQWAIQMKQEIAEGGNPNLQQYEPYSAAPSRPNALAQSRPEAQLPVAEGRRPLPDQQFQSRPPQAPRNFINNENLKSSSNNHREIREREMKSSGSPVIHRTLNERPPQSTPPPQRNDQYSSIQINQPKAQHIPQPSILQASHPPQVAAVRQQEAVPRKTSNIMSLLNEEPSEPRPEPPKRVSNIISTPQPISRTPPPQMPLQSSRFATHQPPQTASQPPQQVSSQPPAHHAQQQPQQHVSHSPHPYAQASPHPLHQHSSSIGQARSYTPTSFDRRGYETNPGIQPPSQQQMYTQPPPRQSIPPQPTIRREPSLGDHGLSAEYGRGAPPQSSSRLKQSPYSSTLPPAAPQPVRQQITSPLDLATPGERDFYARQPQAQYLMQQQSAAASPQLGPSYQGPSQPPQPSHRQLAFGQSQSHMASPPSHFATQHHQQQYQRSRHNSITDSRDPRYPGSTSSGSTPSHAGYAPPPHQPTHPSMQYQHPAHPERFEYDREMRDRRVQEERHQLHHDDRRLLDDQRAREELQNAAAYRQSHHRRMEDPRR